MPTTPEGIMLHHALAAGDPVILFQPILDLSTGLVTGYEALSRFTTLPDLPVDAVFDLAQQLGHGYHLEVLAVLKAMEQGAARPPGTVLSVNLSPSSLCHPALLEALPDDLSGLQVEISEHEAIEYVGLFATRLDELRSRGVRIAVDDVGEAYAGLQRVMRIRPDLLKVDRSLVSRVHEQPAQAALLEAVVHFAARTGALVCAEGVECAEELAVLADLDITYGQGFFIGRPGPGFAEPHRRCGRCASGRWPTRWRCRRRADRAGWSTPCCRSPRPTASTVWRGCSTTSRRRWGPTRWSCRTSTPSAPTSRPSSTARRSSRASATTSRTTPSPAASSRTTWRHRWSWAPRTSTRARRSGWSRTASARC